MYLRICAFMTHGNAPLGSAVDGRSVPALE